jgi:hypothetical protein
MAVQISARVSEATKAWLEQESRATGVKKEFLVEEALLHHLQALHELPADAIVHPRIVVSAETAEVLLGQTEKPTPALQKLMKRHGS